MKSYLNNAINACPVRHVIQLTIQKPICAYYWCLSCPQQVAIIFLLYDTAGSTIQLHFTQLLLCPEMSTILGGSVADLLCRHQPFDSESAFSGPLCLQCLFDVTLAERERHHWVVGVLFCCVPFTPAVECTESNTTRVGHCLPVELITLMAPP